MIVQLYLNIVDIDIDVFFNHFHDVLLQSSQIIRLFMLAALMRHDHLQALVDAVEGADDSVT